MLMFTAQCNVEDVQNRYMLRKLYGNHTKGSIYTKSTSHNSFRLRSINRISECICWNYYYYCYYYDYYLLLLYMHGVTRSTTIWSSLGMNCNLLTFSDKESDKLLFACHRIWIVEFITSK
jgi:hypothetical protein